VIIQVRIYALLDQLAPKPDTMIEIDLQNADVSAADWRFADQKRSIPAKMPRSLMPTGIEQRHDLPQRAFHAFSIRPRLLLLISVTGRLERPASLELHDV
jgi:hypothetical protein